MNRRLGASRLLFLLVAICSPIAVTAAHGSPLPFWSTSGFGTLGLVATDTDDARFRASPRQTVGAGREPNPGIDSRLGLQETVHVNEVVSAVGQLLDSQRDGNIRPQVEWLFAQADVSPWLELRAGRMVLPVFLVSDSRNVGYASHWVRPPSEVYALYPASAFDGAQAQIRAEWGSTHLTVQASAGTSKVDFVGFGQPLNVEFKRLYSLNVIVEQGPWTLRIGDTEALHTKLNNFPLPLAPFTDAFRGMGLIYDNGKVLLQAEVVSRHTDHGGLLNMDGYYVTAGYRMTSWTPYATYSRFMPDGALLTPLPNTRTVAAGLRWDAFHNVALKAQIESAQSNPFNFSSAAPSFSVSSRKANVFTLLSDFVF